MSDISIPIATLERVLRVDSVHGYRREYLCELLQDSGWTLDANTGGDISPMESLISIYYELHPEGEDSE